MLQVQVTGEGPGVRDRLRQHLRNTHTAKTSIYTPTHRQAHECTCTHTHVHAHMHRMCPPTPATQGLHTPPQTFLVPRTHPRTPVPLAPSTFQECPTVFPLQALTSTQTHTCGSPQDHAHTYACTPSRKPYLGKKESHRRQHARVLPPQKACHPYAGLHTHVHSHTRQPLPRFWYSLSNLLQAQRARL